MYRNPPNSHTHTHTLSVHHHPPALGVSLPSIWRLRQNLYWSSTATSVPQDMTRLPDPTPSQCPGDLSCCLCINTNRKVGQFRIFGVLCSINKRKQGLIDSMEERACNLVPIKIQTESKNSNKLCISYGIKVAQVTKIVTLAEFC